MTALLSVIWSTLLKIDMFSANLGNWYRYIYGSDERSVPTISRALIRRVLEYAAPFRGKIVILLVAIAFQTGLQMIPPLLTRELIDVALPNRDFGLLNRLALWLVVVPLFGGLLNVAQRKFSSEIGEGLIRNLRQGLYKHLQSMSLRFFTNTKTGEIMARLNNDVVGAQRAITGTLINLITNSITLVVALAVMFALQWQLTLVSIVLFPLFVLPARRMGGVLRGITRDGMRVNAEMSAHMNETLNVSGALLMKIFGQTNSMYKKFEAHSNEVAELGVRSAVVGRWFFMGLGLVASLGTALVFWFGGYLVLQDAFTVGTVVAFAAYLAKLYGPVSELSNARVELATSLVSFERVFEVLDIPIEIAEQANPTVLKAAEGAIAFEGVSFRYQSEQDAASKVFAGLASQKRMGRDSYANMGMQGQLPDYQAASSRDWAIENVSFTVAPGQLVALVGPSGAGKTTLTYLVPRLYDPTDGAITLDGHDLRSLETESLRANIGMVTQETYLFHDTLRANLLYANPSASEEELINACKIANIYTFISELPDGFDTIVGERGYRLSGGEKQRMAIARVVLKDPQVLILDEATSSLDSQSEYLIQQALEPLFENRTSIVIAHRLSTILAADKIVVLAKGQVAEQGTHSELLALDGLYADLYNTQFRRDLLQ